MHDLWSPLQKRIQNGHKIMKYFKTSLWFDSPQVKWYMKSGRKNIIHELHYELPNNLRFTILGNSEIIRKTKKWIETEPSTQSRFQKIGKNEICENT